MREIILDLMGWRKNIYISHRDFEKGHILVRLTPPLCAMVQQHMTSEYIEVRFVKNGYEKGMAIFNWEK